MWKTTINTSMHTRTCVKSHKLKHTHTHNKVKNVRLKVSERLRDL